MGRKAGQRQFHSSKERLPERLHQELCTQLREEFLRSARRDPWERQDETTYPETGVSVRHGVSK